MNGRLAPYEKIIRVTTMLLLIGYLATYFYPVVMSAWPSYVMIGLAAVIYAMAALEVTQIVQRVRAGHLFFLRTISFYTNIGMFAIVIGVFVVDLVVGGGIDGGWVSPFVLVALLVGYWTQTYPYVYLDSVRLTHRIGTTTTTIPLFNIDGVSEDEQGVLVTAENGTQVAIYASALPAEQYASVRSRLLTK